MFGERMIAIVRGTKTALKSASSPRSNHGNAKLTSIDNSLKSRQLQWKNMLAGWGQNPIALVMFSLAMKLCTNYFMLIQDCCQGSRKEGLLWERKCTSANNPWISFLWMIMDSESREMFHSKESNGMLLIFLLQYYWMLSGRLCYAYVWNRTSRRQWTHYYTDHSTSAVIPRKEYTFYVATACP